MRKKNVVQKENVSGKKIPKSTEDALSYLNKRPSWRFSRCDMEHEKWSVFQDGVLRDDIIEKLKSYEGMTWGEIQQASGGKAEGNGNNSHFENVSDFIKEAQKRIDELKLYEDQLFSLRLKGKPRLYGIIDNGVFDVIWYDKEHEIYKSKKKHA